MQVEFDPAKNAINQGKHGLSLALAATLRWDDALVWVDHRHDYGEQRMVALVPEASILYCVAFVDRGSSRREVKHYVQNI